ncbi:McrB family protein [Prevotella sp.]|uniref:McrB family protein n=1 Tax=Prevotella sp. TaxID=59823 RepID=UPI0040289FA7
MKYISVKSVIESYKGFQDCMTNKSWGYLSLLKGCKGIICSSTPYEVDLDGVSNFLENIFNLSQTKKKYNSGRSLYVVFSSKWSEYFNEQGKRTPNIYDVAIWAYRREAFTDDTTKEDILEKFASEFNIPMEIIRGSFNTNVKDVEFVDALYSETSLKFELNKIGVDVSKDNIDAKKCGVVASPGEISRGPFIQTLYAGLEITDYVIILQSDYETLYGRMDKSDSYDFEPKSNSIYRQYITAIKSKPFLLLAGISGTGKSRIVRELARACWDNDNEEYKAHKPKNFEIIQVKPNWHDSSELLGYVSRVSGEPIYIAGDFIRFIARAWEDPEIPYFLCLDEMNLAPVEQYFAEYLSVIESRKADNEGTVTTDPIIKIQAQQWYYNLVNELTITEDVKTRFLREGICIPQNLIVIGTVNMDETTFSFSRKVLDRAMTIEMNYVDLYGGLTNRYEKIGKLSFNQLVGNAVEGVDIYDINKEVCDIAISYLQGINTKLEGTPFKIAYRTRNEFLLYVVNNLPYNKNDEGEELTTDFVIARALDEITSMKILSRIEGDETKVSVQFLTDLEKIIKESLDTISKENFACEISESTHKSVSLAKLSEMKKRLSSGYTSFWS